MLARKAMAVVKLVTNMALADRLKAVPNVCSRLPALRLCACAKYA